MRGFIHLIVQSLLIIAVFLPSAISNLHAASLHTEDTNPIDFSKLYFNLAPEPINSETTDSKDTKQLDLSPLLKKQTSDKTKNKNLKLPPTDSSSLITDNLVKTSIRSPLIKKDLPPQSFDIVKIGYGKLNEIIEDEVLDDSVLIIRDINIRLNELNQKIDQKVVPAIEDIFIMQRLFSSTGEQELFISKKSQLKITEQQIKNIPITTSDLENLDYEQPEGFFGLLLNLPKYLFNIKNIITLLISLFLLSGFIKIIHFILNRIY